MHKFSFSTNGVEFKLQAVHGLDLKPNMIECTVP